MMKNSRLLSMAAFAILMVVMVSCTTIRDASGGYEDMSSRSRRVYYEDPRYGNTIILERDPYTGQLYEVRSFGGYYSPFNNYGYGNNNPYYNRGRYYNNGRGSVQSKPSKPSTTNPQTKKNFDDARSKVLGGKRQ